MLTSIGQHHSMCGVKSAGAEVHGTSRQLFHQDFTFMFAVYFLYSLLLCVVPYSCQALLMDRPLPASGFSWCLCCPGSDVAVVLRPPPSFQDKKKKKIAPLYLSLLSSEFTYKCKMPKTCLRFIFL